MKAFVALAAVLAIACLALAVAPGEVLVVSPEMKIAKAGGEVFLGTIGPGQSASLGADALVTTGGLFGQGGRWDKLVVVDAPPGWTWSDSLEYEQPLKIKVTAAPDAKDAMYIVHLMAVDYGDKEKIGGNVTFSAVVKVARDVMNLEVSPYAVETGAGQPAGYYVTVENTGASSDIFEITSSGVPLWEFKRQVFVPAGAKKTVVYEVVSEEEKELTITLRAKSLSSPLIQKEQTAKLYARTNLASDFAAAGHGNLLFPVIEAPIYALVGFIANLF